MVHAVVTVQTVGMAHAVTGGTEFVLLKDSTECAGREEKVGHTDTLKGCSAKCLGRSQWFIYGKQGQRCSGNGCECFCEVPGGNECTQTSHSGFKLYKLSQVVSQGLLPVPCRAVPCRAVPCHALPCRAALFLDPLSLKRMFLDPLSLATLSTPPTPPHHRTKSFMLQ